MTDTDSETPPEATDVSADTISGSDVLKTLELGCWIAMLAMPIKAWISGSAVSRDQAWIRTTMIVVASVGVVSSIVYRLRRRWSSPAESLIS